jgi:hypothetical protein
LGLEDSADEQSQTVNKISEPRPLTSSASPPGLGLSLRDLFLPGGTKLRMTFKGKLHVAEIRGGLWLAENGEKHLTPSAAHNAISGTNANGWNKWEAKRPNDGAWRRLSLLRKSSL